MSTLQQLGYGRFFSAQVELLPPATELVPARVTTESHGLFELAGCHSALGQLSGRLRRELRGVDRLTTGDWVMVSEGAGTSHAVIHHALDRRTLLKRRAASSETGVQVVAANVDLFFIVTSASQEFNARRLERYLTAVWDSGAEPAVVLNKVDLLDDLPSTLQAIEKVAAGAPVLQVSALCGTGMEELESHLEQGKTVGFIGSSGVGKSSLTNRIFGHAAQAIQAVGSEAKGRHTTTRKQLMVIPGKGIILDTPGLRELGMVHDEVGLDRAFSDLAEFAQQCRFRDCQHTAEPGCAVRAAVDAGELPGERLDSYQKLGREMRAAQVRQDPVVASNAKRRWKAIARSQRKQQR